MSRQDRYTSFAVEVEEVKDGVLTGIATRYNTPVSRGPRLWEGIRPGAFKAQVGAPNRVAVLWQHDRDAPIGRATDLTDSEEMLRFKARVTRHEDVPEARKALALLEEGIVDEVSVGFDWQTWETQETDEGTTYWHTKSRLREFSIVTFGALGQDARVITVASDQSMQEALAYRARLAALRA